LVVGDKILFIKKNGAYVLIFREERTNYLARFRGDADRPTLAKRERQVIAANLDYAVIVAAAKNPNFHPNLIDRYLILCQNG
jgi:ribosome biogenesis GTPase